MKFRKQWHRERKPVGPSLAELIAAHERSDLIADARRSNAAVGIEYVAPDRLKVSGEMVDRTPRALAEPASDRIE